MEKQTFHKALLILVIIIFAVLVSSNITDSLYHYYNFNNNSLQDQNTSNNATTFIGNGVNFVDGLPTLGRAIRLNDSAYLNGSVQETQFLTISFWINSTVTGVNGGGIISNGFNSSEKSG